MNQDRIRTPEKGNKILIKAKTLKCWFLVPVSSVEGSYITTGDGMGTVVVYVSDYGKTWKWPSYNH